MQAETNRQISDGLSNVRRKLIELLRIAGSDPAPSKHTLKALRTMVGECDHEMARVAG